MSRRAVRAALLRVLLWGLALGVTGTLAAGLFIQYAPSPWVALLGLAVVAGVSGFAILRTEAALFAGRDR